MAAQRRLGNICGRPEAIVGRRAAILRGLVGILGHVGGICGLSGLSWKPSLVL